ncbi:MAG: SDR family oxidoreductase [Polyangiaceae bacterium]|nr:SDR family oxidoreductase [Polyangiaceae bacterium]
MTAPSPHICTSSNTSEDNWALILGASSGFGAATSIALAKAGFHIVGVHMDLRSTRHLADNIESQVKSHNRQAWFYNSNAADETKRDAILSDVASRWLSTNPNAQQQPKFRVFVHSLAFGSLLPFIRIPPSQPEDRTSLLQLEMTCRVMAHSFVSWTQAIVERQLMGFGGRVFAMTSAGARTVWKGYGAVSAAKAAIEAYVRQLAVELAPIGITVNALCPGVTETQALLKVPDHQHMMSIALHKHPQHRLTQPEDVAAAIIALSAPETYWITGNVINVEGGESISG